MMNARWYTTKVVPAEGCVLGITMDTSDNVYFTDVAGLWKFNMKEDTVPKCLLEKSGLMDLVWLPTNQVLFCGNNDNKIYKYDVCNGQVTFWNPLLHGVDLLKPWGIALDHQDGFIITHKHSVLRVDMNTNEAEIIAGKNYADFKEGYKEEARFHEPVGVIVNSKNDVYVCDSENHTIRIIRDGNVSSLQLVPEELAKDFQYPYSIQFFRNENTLVVGSALHLWMGHMKEDAWYPKIICKGRAFSVFVDQYGGILVGQVGKFVRIEEFWKYQRFLWIAHLKEDIVYCGLAAMPRDIIKEIASQLTHKVTC